MLYIHQMELEPNDKKDKAKHDPHRSADSAESRCCYARGKKLDCQVARVVLSLFDTKVELAMGR